MKLFLDIDGVMVHANPTKKVEFEKDGFYKFSDDAVTVLNSVVSNEIEIILSTSHRHRYSLYKWKKIFIHRGINIRKLSIIKSELVHSKSRRLEIEDWIQQKKIKPEDMIILDDDKSLNGLSEKYKERLVLTNSLTGLSRNNVTELRRIIRTTNK